MPELWTRLTLTLGCVCVCAFIHSEGLFLMKASHHQYKTHF